MFFLKDEKRVMSVFLGGWAADPRLLTKVAPDVGIDFAADHTEVLLGCEVIVLLGVRTSGRLKQQPHYKRFFALEHWVRGNERINLREELLLLRHTSSHYIKDAE